MDIQEMIEQRQQEIDALKAGSGLGEAGDQALTLARAVTQRQALAVERVIMQAYEEEYTRVFSMFSGRAPTYSEMCLRRETLHYRIRRAAHEAR